MAKVHGGKRNKMCIGVKYNLVRICKRAFLDLRFTGAYNGNMILDNLSQWHRYATLGSRFEKAFRYLETITPATPVGRYELEGKDLYAMVSSYATRSTDQFRFEAHRRYADVQFIVAGRECILWAPLVSLPTVTEAYNAEKDFLFFAPPASYTPLNMGVGQFAVFFPEDGHAPGIEWGGMGEVLKVVLKVGV